MIIAQAAVRRGWYYGWNIVAVCVVGQIAATALPVSTFSLFLHDWSAQFHQPVSTLQLGLAADGVACAVLSPFVGILVDKYPTRNLLALGLLGIALFSLGMGFATAFWHYMVLYGIVLPISVMLSTAVPSNALISRWFLRRRGLALGLTSLGLSASGVLMAPIVGAALPALGWRAIWQIGGLLTAFLVVPLVFFVVRNRVTEREGFHYLVDEGATAYHEADSLGWREILSRRNFWLLVIVYLPMLTVFGTCGNNLAPIATSRGLTLQTAGVVLALFSLSQMAGTLVVGMVSDRFGNRMPLVSLAFLSALGGVVLGHGQGVFVITIGAMLAALGGSFWPVLASAIAEEFGASGVGRAFGMLTLFLPVMALAPFAVAKIQERTGSYGPGLDALAFLSLLGGLACLSLRERRNA